MKGIDITIRSTSTTILDLTLVGTIDLTIQIQTGNAAGTPTVTEIAGSATVGKV